MEARQLLACYHFLPNIVLNIGGTQEIQQMCKRSLQSLPQKVMDEQIERLTMPLTMEELDDVIAHASTAKAFRLESIPS